MARKLLNFCLAWTLVLGCWGGVLAAAACPHLGCETAAAGPEHVAAHDGHSPGQSFEAAGAEDHSAHADVHPGHTAGQTVREQLPPESVEMRGVKSGRHDSSCTHCVGRPDAPPSSSFEWQTNSAKKSGKVAAAHSAGQSLTPAAFFVREITPAQHAPPGSQDRHLLLLNVFRI